MVYQLTIKQCFVILFSVQYRLNKSFWCNNLLKLVTIRQPTTKFQAETIVFITSRFEFSHLYWYSTVQTKEWVLHENPWEIYSTYNPDESTHRKTCSIYLPWDSTEDKVVQSEFHGWDYRQRRQACWQGSYWCAKGIIF